MASRVRSWLSADVQDVVVVTPRRRPRGTHAGGGGLDLPMGLHRWARQLSRRRAAVLARRYALTALLIALVPAAVALAVGARRPFWVLALLVLAPGAGAVALLRPPRAQRTAHLLDRSLGLHERLGTALELNAAPIPPSGLAGMVLSEATQTLDRSWTTARAQTRRAPAEWAWLILAVCLLAGVLALPRHADMRREAHTGALGASARAPDSGGGRGARTAQRRVSTTPAQVRTSAGVPVARVPLTGGTKAAYGRQVNRPAGARAPIDAQGSAQVQGQHGKAGLGVSGAKGAAGHQGTASPAGAGAQGGRAGGASASPSSGRPGSEHEAKTTSGTVGAHSGVTSTTPGATAGASNASRGQGRGGTPAGGRAGTGNAAPNAKLGLEPYGGVGVEKTGLPLQASYTPGGSAHATPHEGVSQTNGTGGGGAGKSGHPGSGSGSGTGTGGGSGTDFPVIAPTPNTSSPGDDDLLANYFGSANQLTFKGW